MSKLLLHLHGLPDDASLIVEEYGTDIRISVRDHIGEWGRSQHAILSRDNLQRLIEAVACKIVDAACNDGCDAAG